MNQLPKTIEEVTAWKLTIQDPNQSVEKILCQGVSIDRIHSVRSAIIGWVSFVINEWPGQVELKETSSSFKVYCFGVFMGYYESDDIIRMLCRYSHVKLETIF